MGRCLSPCLGDLDPNAYRRQLDAALALFEGPGEAQERLLAHIEAEMSAAASQQRFERAAALRRRHERLSGLLERLGGVLRATHDAPRLVLARHPAKESFDALWIVQGRVADWGPLPSASELAERTEAALRRLPLRGRSVLPAEEVDEVRIVSSWCASEEPPTLALRDPPGEAELRRFVQAARRMPANQPATAV